MPRPSNEFRASLAGATASYHQALLAPSDPGSLSGLARGYLAARGIGRQAIESYQIGVVDGSHPEHEMYRGRISFPYLTRLGGPLRLNFRVAHDCDDTCEHAKYISPYETRIYNALAFDKADRLGYIAVTEGEINAITLDFICGIPAVGLPGAKSWKAHPEWRELFAGYGRVVLFKDVDADAAGDRLAEQVQRDLDTLKVLTLPGEVDVNKFYLQHGNEGIQTIREMADVG